MRVTPRDDAPRVVVPATAADDDRAVVQARRHFGTVDAGGADFPSLLSPSGWVRRPDGERPDGDVLRDLRLDEIIASVTGDHEERAFIAARLSEPSRDPVVVRFRQEVFEDMEDVGLRRAVTAALERLGQVRLHLAQVDTLRSAAQREGWFLDAVATYCDAVGMLHRALDAAPVASEGFLAVREYLARYQESSAFMALSEETAECKRTLSRIRYNVRIQGGRVEVGRYRGEPDYSAEVRDVFARLEDAGAKDYRVRYRSGPGMDHVGERIADLVVRLFPAEFAALAAYCARHGDFYDPELRRIEREAHFYLSYAAYIAPLRAAGLPFCYPEVGEGKDTYVRETFDLALAKHHQQSGDTVVRNDFTLSAPERIIVVSGPNQGGKTTFARAFGQLHHLAALGCAVPGSAARLHLCDRIFTLFERKEQMLSMRGRLEDDVVRAQHALLAATPDSVIVVNELFSSTTIRDARALGEKVLAKMVDLDVVAVYVTFVDELASFGPAVVSMVSTVASEDPTVRTFRIVRGPADGLAHALAIARAHGLTYERLRERIEQGGRE